MDSGSAVSVAPKTVAPWIPMTESEGSRNGVEYTAADGGKIPNLGQQVLEVTTEEGTPAVVTYQVADVIRPLNAVSAICDAGNEVTFTRTGGYIANEMSGQMTMFRRENNVYVMGMWMLRPPDGGAQQGVQHSAPPAAGSFPRPSR